MEPTVSRHVVLPVDRESAWEAVTRSEELEGWLADEVELDLWEGGELRAAWHDGEERRGTVEEIEPERALRFTWRRDGDREASEVQFRLDDDPGGTRITVLERRLGAGPIASAQPLSTPGRRRSAGPIAWAPRLSALAAHASMATCPA